MRDLSNCLEVKALLKATSGRNTAVVAPVQYIELLTFTFPRATELLLLVFIFSLEDSALRSIHNRILSEFVRALTGLTLWQSAHLFIMPSSYLTGNVLVSWVPIRYQSVTVQGNSRCLLWKQ